MGVAKYGKPVAAHCDRCRRALNAGLHGLVREAVHEVEVDVTYPNPAQVFNSRGRLRLSLDPVGCFLNNGIKALHAETHVAYLGRS